MIRRRLEAHYLNLLRRSKSLLKKGWGGGLQSKFCMVFIIPDIGISFKEFLKCIRYFLIIGKTKVSFMWLFEQEK